MRQGALAAAARLGDGDGDGLLLLCSKQLWRGLQVPFRTGGARRPEVTLTPKLSLGLSETEDLGLISGTHGKWPAGTTSVLAPRDPGCYPVYSSTTSPCRSPASASGHRSNANHTMCTLRP